MSIDSINLLASFDALAVAEQQAVAKEILRRAAPRGAASLDDVDVQRAQGENDQHVVHDGQDLSDDKDDLPYDEWLAAFRKWTRSHTLHNPKVDASRESIYPGPTD